MPGCDRSPRGQRLPAIRMESCPRSFGTLPVIAWTAARDQMERCPPSAWNGARDGVEYAAQVIRIDALWLAVGPLDMRAGTDTVLARVVAVFGAAHPHHAYLFANKRATRLKVLVHDGIGIWLCARRLHQGRFVWPTPGGTQQIALSRAQFDALVLGLPLQRIGEAGVIRVL